MPPQRLPEQLLFVADILFVLHFGVKQICQKDGCVRICKSLDCYTGEFVYVVEHCINYLCYICALIILLWNFLLLTNRLRCGALRLLMMIILWTPKLREKIELSEPRGLMISSALISLLCHRENKRNFVCLHSLA